MNKREYLRAYYLANREKLASQARARYLANREERLAKMREYGKSAKGIEVKNSYAKIRVAVSQAWRKRNPEKWKAHSALYYAIYSGKIVRPKICERCNKTGRVEAHHGDYSKPLEVTWLCRPCHVEEHLL